MDVFIIFLVGFCIGGIVECAIGFLIEFFERKPIRINHRFTFAKKVSLVSLPVWGILAVLFFRNVRSYAELFIFSAIIGTLLEGMLGRFLKKTFGVKIWTYKKGSIANFTSFYAIPYWGAAGLVFALLGKSLGL